MRIAELQGIYFLHRLYFVAYLLHILYDRSDHTFSSLFSLSVHDCLELLEVKVTFHFSSFSKVI